VDILRVRCEFFFFDLVAGVASNLFLSLPMTFVAGDAN